MFSKRKKISIPHLSTSGGKGFSSRILSTPTVEVRFSIKEIGFSVQQVTTVQQKITKNELPMFFIDLEPAEINNVIFGITSLLYTKIKVEGSCKRKDIIKCQNCQDFGHTRIYCSYSPRCVRCGSRHLSSSCSKSTVTPTNVRPEYGEL